MPHEGVPGELQLHVECRILKLAVEGFKGGQESMAVPMAVPIAVPMAHAFSTAFCVLFTGGTFRSRCVVVSHAMLEHESARYSECVKIEFPLRITCHTSVYWGASLLGQISIALAFGGCAVLCEVPLIEDFKAVLQEEQVNAIGLVPDQLKLLAEDPSKELPNIRVVFSWGEKLPMNVARRWATHGARLRELLVSTEYWLSFWSAPLEGLKGHHIVSGVETLVLDEGRLADVGELFIRGPMVTPGYLGCDESPFIEFQGKSYFRTRDLVQRWPDGSLEFRGRADMTMKQRGQWVDLFTMQSKLEALEAVEESALLPCPEGGATIHIFLVLKVSNAEDVGRVIQGARRLIDGEVHTLSILPRHPVTQKVDVRALKALVKKNQETWPLNPAASADAVTLNRGREKLREIFLWTAVALLAGLSWDLQHLRRSFLGIFMLPYMHLSFLHAVDEDTLLGRFMSAAAEKMPMGIWGTMFLTLLSRSLSSVLRDRLRPRGLKELLCAWNVASKMLLGGWLTHGVLKSWQRGRLFQYVVVFWWGIGHRLQYDLERWCTWRYWKWYFQAFFTSPEAETHERREREVKKEAEEEAESLRCSMCCRSMETAWPPPVIPEKFALIRQPTNVFGSKDRLGNPICWGCWVLSSSAACEEGHELAKSLLTEHEGGEEDQEQVEESTWCEWARQQPKNQEEKWQYDTWWWRNKTVDYVDLKASQKEKIECRAEASDPKLRQIYKVLQDILRTDVRDDLPFHSLDSLALGLLVGRLRAQFGVNLSITQLRNASPQDLPQMIQEAASVDGLAVPQEDEEYAVWFSPGQYFPMGGWVLRKDGEIDCERMKDSAAQVVLRHAALRAVPSDPLRLLSFVLDTAVMFTLAARLLDRNVVTRQLRRLVSWALRHSWSRIAIKKPDIYPNSTPLVHLTVTDQQAAEAHAKERRSLLAKSGNPLDIALIQVCVQLEGPMGLRTEWRDGGLHHSV